jgi:arsenate reductase
MAAPIVLILCTGNSARSQMAEGLLRSKVGGSYQVMSAGTEPATRVNPIAIESMREVGIDISEARPKDLGQLLGRVAVRHLITVCHDADACCPTVWPGVNSREHWPIEDPAAFRGGAEATLAKFRGVRDELSRRLDHWLAERSATVR